MRIVSVDFPTTFLLVVSPDLVPLYHFESSCRFYCGYPPPTAAGGYSSGNTLSAVLGLSSRMRRKDGYDRRAIHAHRDDHNFPNSYQTATETQYGPQAVFVSTQSCQTRFDYTVYLEGRAGCVLAYCGLVEYLEVVGRLVYAAFYEEDADGADNRNDVEMLAPCPTFGICPNRLVAVFERTLDSALGFWRKPLF